VAGPIKALDDAPYQCTFARAMGQCKMFQCPRPTCAFRSRVDKVSIGKG
jgi:hypothetical protein